MKALIIGAGVAGLSCAIAMKLRGIDVEILERSNKLTEVGAGLQISPNGLKVIKALGVDLQLPFEPESVVMRMGRSGKTVFSLLLRNYAKSRWGEDFIQIHRADLQKSLLSRSEELGIKIHYGSEIDANKISALSKALKNENGILIGADGVHSVTRQAFFETPPPSFSGNVAYRTVIPLCELQNPPPPSAVIWAGRKQHAVTTRVRAGELVNFVGVCEESDWKEDGWNHPIDPSIVSNKFKNWHPSIIEILKKSNSMKRWALLSHPPLKSFYQGNVVLIGDAAHPMLPSFAQGAVQALEDSYTLAACINKGTLQDFDNLRLERVKKVQSASLDNLRQYHRGVIGRAAFYNGAQLFSAVYPEFLFKRLDWVYGYDVKSAVQSYF